MTTKAKGKSKRRPLNIVINRGANLPPVPRAPQAWELAAKRVAPAASFVRNREDLIGRFFLSLSLAFNDLKGLVMFEQYLAAMGRPARADYSPHFGQWHGTNVQIHRWIAGVLHEIMNVIDARQFRTVVNGVELGELVRSVSPENQRAWAELVTVARAPTSQPGMNVLLLRIRNDAGFHYDYRGRALGDAYLRFFELAAGAPTDGNNGAQYSLGVDMDGTRFYYADAAAQQAMTTLLGANNATIEQVFDVAAKVNLALAALIGAFIRSREAT